MPWFISGYPRGGSIPSGLVWFEYGGLSHASSLHDCLYGANYSAADPCLYPLRVRAGWMKPRDLLSILLHRPGALCRALVDPLLRNGDGLELAGGYNGWSRLVGRGNELINPQGGFRLYPKTARLSRM